MRGVRWLLDVFDYLLVIVYSVPECFDDCRVYTING